MQPSTCLLLLRRTMSPTFLTFLIGGKRRPSESQPYSQSDAEQLWLHHSRCRHVMFNAKRWFLNGSKMFTLVKQGRASSSLFSTSTSTCPPPAVRRGLVRNVEAVQILLQAFSFTILFQFIKDRLNPNSFTTPTASPYPYPSAILVGHYYRSMMSSIVAGHLRLCVPALLLCATSMTWITLLVEG